MFHDFTLPSEFWGFMKQHSLEFIANAKLAREPSIQLFLHTFGNKSFYFLHFFFKKEAIKIGNFRFQMFYCILVAE